MSCLIPNSHLTPWINKLPEDWRKVRIDSVADVFFSNVDKHTLDEEMPVRLCNYTDVYKNDKITRVIDFMEASAEPREIERFQIRQGDLLVTKDSETPDDIAISALVAEELPGVLCGYHLGMIRSRSKSIYGSFLFWLHASKQFRAQYEARAVGVTRFGLPQYAFRSAKIPLPPIAEQKRIATFLDTSCAAIAAAVAAKRHQIEILKTLKHSNIYGAVTRGFHNGTKFKESGLDWLREIPSHWSIRRIKDIGELRSGDAIRAEDIFPSGDYPVYGGNGLRGYTSSYTHDGHFVLIGRQGALCGNINYAKGRFWATEHAVVVTSLRQYNRLWLGELLRVMNLNQYSNAAAQPGLAVDRIKFLKIPLPPTEEQSAIARGLEQIILSNERISAQMERQIGALVAYRKSLIHEFVTGQRRITEAEVAKVRDWERDGEKFI
jgi:type I restriction enzyme S subunit